MLRIDGIKLPPGHDRSALKEHACRVLRVPGDAIRDLRILRRSVDAREGVLLLYSIGVSLDSEDTVLRRCRSSHVSRYETPCYRLPPRVSTARSRPVVIGAGPAGLFCALTLALCGAPAILLERGQRVEQRRADVERFWTTGELDERSNVQFGEGGAGAFSDGKLNTGTKDPRHHFILERFVEFGAPDTILYDAKPHIGTDKLYVALQNLRQTLLSLGTDIRFGHTVVDITQSGGVLTSLCVAAPDGDYDLPCSQAVFALGHSARDTFAMLHRRCVLMEAKPFSVGVRIEHSQRDMDAAQYKQYAGHPGLSATSYKLSCHLSSGRGVYSFCVCPGGQVVAAASEAQRVVTNGMSEYARDRENINGALLVNITPSDYGGETDPLAGIAFQRRLEEAAYCAGGGGYIAPAQLVGDFLAHRASEKAGRIAPSYRPGVKFTDLGECLPPFVCDALREAIPLLDKKVRGFAFDDAVLTAVETRSSSPVRIVRDAATYQSPLAGLYPCGEGAGYAGGIMSAAADGIRCAEQILEVLRNG